MTFLHRPGHQIPSIRQVGLSECRGWLRRGRERSKGQYVLFVLFCFLFLLFFFFSASALPYLSDKRKLEKGGRKRRPQERTLSGVAASWRRQAVLSLPALPPTMEPALIVLNVDDSHATAPQGQILAKMIDRPWSEEADDV